MSHKEIALWFDEQVCPVEAAWAYEVALRTPGADRELFLNLAVLYFVCTDFGYIVSKKLAQKFADVAYERAFEVLHDAEIQFGRDAEIEFWRLYIPERVLGSEPPDGAYEHLARTGDSLVPYLYLYGLSDGVDYRGEMAQLLEAVQDGSTERKRYLKSVIESSATPRITK